jgi:hypothetical protein
MASTAGLAAWQKYFAGKGQIDTTLKKMTKTFLPDNKPGPVLPAGTVVSVLPLKDSKEYMSYVRSKGTGPKVNAHIPIVYNRKTLLCSLDDMSKPREGKTVDLKLQTVNLVKGARIEKFDIMGYEDVECATFKSVSEFQKIVLTNLANNKLLDTVMPFKKSVLSYFGSNDPSRIKWMGTVGDGEKQQFAKYLGEIAIGFALLANKKVIAGTNPFVNRRVDKFILPLDEAFPGADSLFLLKDGTFIPVSSKANVGAAASFFANILLPAIKNTKYLKKNSVFKEIYETAISLGMADEKKLKAGGKRIVYEYGLREILKVPKSALKDTYQVYEEFRKYKNLPDYSTEVRNVYNKLKMLMEARKDNTALQNLDASTTVFLCREIARKLNDDVESMNQMKNIIGGKKFFQANLNTTKLFKAGEIEFKMIESGDAFLTIIGNKSPYNNIEATQGTLNYVLKYR